MVKQPHGLLHLLRSLSKFLSRLAIVSMSKKNLRLFISIKQKCIEKVNSFALGLL